MEKLSSLQTQPQKPEIQQGKTAKKQESVTLKAGMIYHIYNRGVNGLTIFLHKRNYEYFINLYARHIQPVAETYAFCLLPNHFHLMIKVRDLVGSGGIPDTKSASQAFSNLFNAYAKAINKAYKRTGPLFERPFKRIPIQDPDYHARLMIYIHQNPQRHGLIDDYRGWPYSSYAIFTGDRPTFVRKDVLSAWFEDVQGYRSAHAPVIDARLLIDIIEDD